MTIGELAKRAKVNVETVRYYQRIELMSTPSKPRSGFRKYSKLDLERLSFIRRSKELGFSLVDIRELLSLQQQDGSCEDICSLAEKNLYTIRQRIKDLRNLEKDISELIASCREAPECLILKTLEQPTAVF